MEIIHSPRFIIAKRKNVLWLRVKEKCNGKRKKEKNVDFHFGN